MLHFCGGDLYNSQVLRAATGDGRPADRKTITATGDRQAGDRQPATGRTAKTAKTATGRTADRRPATGVRKNGKNGKNSNRRTGKQLRRRATGDGRTAKMATGRTADRRPATGVRKNGKNGKNGNRRPADRKTADLPGGRLLVEGSLLPTYSYNLLPVAGSLSPVACCRLIHIAKGSVAELMTQIIIANEIGYLSGETANDFINECDKISAMLSKLIRARGN